MKSTLAIVLALFATSVLSAQPPGPPAPAAGPKWVTLGTNGGPVASPSRSEPANALVVGRDVYLVDTGDGTYDQMGKAGLAFGQVRAVFLSHLHFDHIGGLSALIGLRNQLGIPGVLTIYGPPGTKALVDGLAAAMIPSANAAYGYAGRPFADPAKSVAAVEMMDGSTAQLGSVKVTARQNSHYSFEPGSDLDRRYKSISFRFDVPERSIVYTGDTGPSTAVEELAAGADLLVAEMIDLDKYGTLTRPVLQSTNATAQPMGEHLRDHHITATQVGEMAARAKVRSVVITHLVAAGATAADLMRYHAEIGKNFTGPVVVANDLDSF